MTDDNLTAPSWAEAQGRARQLSRWGRTWRLLVLAAGLTALTLGQLHDTNDYFPFGSLNQYATASDPNGRVRSTYVEADTVSGDRVAVPLNARGAGVGRAEIEGQLNRIIEDPSLLQGLADVVAARHPDWDQYTHLYLMRDAYQLRDGERVGDPETELLAEWRVR